MFYGTAAVSAAIFDATVVPLLMIDHPRTNEHLREHEMLTSDLLSPRPRWNRRWCYHRQVPKLLCDNHHRVGNIITVPSGINPRATVASIKLLLEGVKTSKWSRFVLSHAHALGILHYRVRHITPIQSIFPTSQLNATVRAAFMPDSTLEFLPIFSCSKCTNASIFSHFLHS